MRLLKKSNKNTESDKDKYFECTCYNCKSLFVFKSKDLIITEGRRNSDNNKKIKLVECPNCKSRNKKDDRKGLSALFKDPNGFVEIDEEYYYELISKYDE